MYYLFVETYGMYSPFWEAKRTQPNIVLLASADGIGNTWTQMFIPLQAAPAQVSLEAFLSPWN